MCSCTRYEWLRLENAAISGVQLVGVHIWLKCRSVYQTTDGLIQNGYRVRSAAHKMIRNTRIKSVAHKQFYTGRLAIIRPDGYFGFYDAKIMPE